MTKRKIVLRCLCLIAALVAGWHYQPIETTIFVALFACIALFVGLQIYFMPIKDKLNSIAKAKARHGIPLDQPHRVDKILKSGFFRIP